MASVIETETIGNLVINRMTKEIYQELKDNGQINPYEMYLITGGDTPANVTTYTATVSATWSGTSAPYQQTVSVNGILETDNPHITPVYSSDLVTALLEKEAWNKIGYAVSGSNAITFTCLEEKPTQTLNIQIEVVR